MESRDPSMRINLGKKSKKEEPLAEVPSQPDRLTEIRESIQQQLDREERERMERIRIQDREIRRRANEIIQHWFQNTQVYLATSSKVREQGVIKEGVKAENIHLVAMPDELEIVALDDYLEDFQPSWVDKNGTKGMEVVAERKAEFLEEQGVPRDSLWLAMDTLPVYYETNPKFSEHEKPEGGPWKGKTEKKPENREQIKEIGKKTFLSIMRNSIRFQEFLKRAGKKGWSELEQNPDKYVVDSYKRMDFASAVHVKTALAVHFPNEDKIYVHADRIIVRPRRLYQIAKELELSESPDDPRLFTPESLRDKVHAPSGKTVDQLLDEILDEIYNAMEEAQVNPLKISGGIAYHLDAVKQILDVQEMPNVIDYTGLDPTIYTGFPRNLFRDVLIEKADRMARHEIIK